MSDFSSFGKMVENDELSDFASFEFFLAKTEVKCYRKWIELKPDLESSHEGENFRPQSERVLKTLDWRKKQRIALDQ